jgi:hypothetical protein
MAIEATYTEGHPDRLPQRHSAAKGRNQKFTAEARRAQRKQPLTKQSGKTRRSIMLVSWRCLSGRVSAGGSSGQEYNEDLETLRVLDMIICESED